MAEKDQASHPGISRAIRTERQSNDTTDLSRLDRTLVKSPRWKNNTFRKIENDRSPGPVDAAEDDVADMLSVPRGSRRMRQALEHHVEEAKAAREQLRKQSKTLLELRREIDRLRQDVATLEAEKAGLLAKHRDELEARRTELLDFQAAYDQFQQQSDLLMDELDEKNARLLLAVRHQDPSSLL